MFWTSGPFRLPAVALSAALVFAIQSASGQAPSPPAAAPPTLSDSQVASTPSGVAAPLATPATPATPEELGDSLMTHERYQAAIAAYKKAPTSAEVLNKLGIAYQLMFNLEEASRCYQASLKLDPKNSRVLNNLATVYDSMKDYGSAERIYKKAVKLDSHSAMIYKNLGTNLLAQHKYKKGWEFYKTALQLDPRVFEGGTSPRVQNPASIEERGAMNFYMAKGCVRAGMSDCAIEYLRMALNEGFTDPKRIKADGEFAKLRGIPAFEQLLASQKQQ